MSLKSNILRDANGNIIVQMEGEINYEYSIPFRDELTQLAKENPNTDITIDLGGIDFVGSSGICHFVESIKMLTNTTKQQVGLSNVRSEFAKVFKLYNLNETDVIMDYFDMNDDETFGLNTFHGNRGRTFEQ